jgi:hypothetical protein
LRLAATLGHRFREVGKEQRGPEPEGDLQIEAGEVCQRENARRHRAEQHDEHDGIFPLHAGVELAQRLDQRGTDERWVKDGAFHKIKTHALAA